MELTIYDESMTESHKQHKITGIMIRVTKANGTKKNNLSQFSMVRLFDKLNHCTEI